MDSVTKIKAPDSPGDEAGGRSSIKFPYSDLDSSIEVVRGVHNAGGNSCDIEQLAAQLDMESKGGGFRLRINSAETFGLTKYERGGRISLTPQGKKILNPGTEKKARMDAFLEVELYTKFYDEFKGSTLPPTAAIERAITKLGVGPKVADRARQALMRSAKQAGFLDQSPDRLVKPSFRDTDQSGDDGADDSTKAKDKSGDDTKGGGNGGGGGGSNGGGGQHPLISGLLVTLPQPGSAWKTTDRINWLNMASSIFNAIYTKDSDDTISIEVKEKT